MKCPNCSNETSDAASVCEWCGSLLYQQSHAPLSPEQGRAQQGYPPQVPPPAGYPPQVPPPRVGVPAPPPGGYAPGDAGYYGYRPQPQPPRGNKLSDPSPWYYSPWPYVVALVLVLAIIGGVLVTQKSTKSSPSGSTYADFVVGGKPTLVDFYTDT